MIDRMLVVVFDTEEKAYEGTKALFQLQKRGQFHGLCIVSGATRLMYSVTARKMLKAVA